MMIGGGEGVLERGVALIDVVFLLGVLALFLVLLFPLYEKDGAAGDRVTVGAEGETVEP